MAHAVLLIKVRPIEPGREILISDLSDIDFEGFLETEEGVDAYIEESELDMKKVEEVFNQMREAEFEVSCTYSVAEEKNWNEEWEKNFDPVEIKDLCRIRAPFHDSKAGFKKEILIMPKMSFGTGHHATTSMMVENLMTVKTEGPLLDMGSGTAVLAILARKLGVEDVTAIDIDDWAFENAPDNCELNNIDDIVILQGDASLLGKKKFNTVLANINRNVLLEDIPIYASVLNKNGQLFVSGFYVEDLPMILEVAVRSGFIFNGNLTQNNWVSARFIKQ
ncbi:MAG: 50S ribosomal protein L11 methyltransferase [Flavobacteriales bacterium]|nr:50S ribosomal protein L11 methyltransferase [Flavobacteriales bacterium]